MLFVSGFESLLIKHDTNTACSFCTANPFIEARVVSATNSLIDHVFLKSTSSKQIQSTKVKSFNIKSSVNLNFKIWSPTPVQTHSFTKHLLCCSPLVVLLSHCKILVVLFVQILINTMDKEAEPMEETLSDHYGLSVVLSLTPWCGL